VAGASSQPCHARGSTSSAVDAPPRRPVSQGSDRQNTKRPQSAITGHMSPAAASARGIVLPCGGAPVAARAGFVRQRIDDTGQRTPASGRLTPRSAQVIRSNRLSPHMSGSLRCLRDHYVRLMPRNRRQRIYAIEYAALLRAADFVTKRHGYPAGIAAIPRLGGV